MRPRTSNVIPAPSVHWEAGIQQMTFPHEGETWMRESRVLDPRFPRSLSGWWGGGDKSSETPNGLFLFSFLPPILL